MGINIKQRLLGRRLNTSDLAHQAISKPVGLAVFASDALSSTAYATEEILLILTVAVGGGAATMWASGGNILGLSVPIALAIAVLLVIVTVSYRQTIFAYPNGGGAYIVAKDNLGEVPALIAGAALLTDYILTVAVSISSGVSQITSAFPDLLPIKVEIAVGVIILITVVNLRGVKESGRVFAVPTYFFLGMIMMTIGVGILRFFSGTLPTVTGVEAIHHVVEPLTIFLVLRAFSSGCTALTGIEAISNGISAFQKPRSQNAATTLVWMSGILIALFLGITFMANQIQAVPSHTETVISQIGRTVYGDGSILYYMLLAGTALILLMAANTSYADFPRLAALQASDGFLPRQLTHRGGRLVYSVGIIVLAGLASLLVIIMNASVSALIPLYAIGVFLSFTISQSGMVIHLNKMGKMKPGEVHQGLETEIHYDKNWRAKMIISAVGAFCTFIVMIVFAVTKFTSGAWFVVILIPILVTVFFRIHRHYKEVAHALSLQGVPVDTHVRPVQTLILVDDVHAESVRMVNFAKSLEHPWKAIHIATNPDKVEIVKKKWDKRIGEGELVIIPSPFRLLNEPLREFVEQVRAEQPDGFIHVIIGHLVMDTAWEQSLHHNSAYLFNLALAGLDRVVVTIVPYQIHHEKDSDGHDHLISEDRRRAEQLEASVVPPEIPPEAPAPTPQ